MTSLIPVLILLRKDNGEEDADWLVKYEDILEFKHSTIKLFIVHYTWHTYT